MKLGTLPPVPDCHGIISKQEELNVFMSFKRQAESLSSEQRALCSSIDVYIIPMCIFTHIEVYVLCIAGYLTVHNCLLFY